MLAGKRRTDHTSPEYSKPHTLGSYMDTQYEKYTGEKIGNSDHILKGKYVINSLRNWLKKNKGADPSDIETAQRIMKEIQDALDGN